VNFRFCKLLIDHFSKICIVKYWLPIYLVILIAPYYSSLQAQIGGDNTYEFLNLTPSARIAAMGGDFLTINDNDITLIPANPSLLNKDMHNHLGVAYVDFFSDVNYGFASYSRTFDKLGSFATSLKYINYGKFDYADATGERTGNFYAGETALDLGWGRQLDSLFAIGANLKLIYSSLESYNSFGLAVDVAGSYFSRDKSFTMSLIAKNIGRQLKPYDGGNIEPLPFELQVGLSKRLAHLPFRYSILINHLEKWDLRYEDPLLTQTDAITGEVQEISGIEEFADNFARHIVIGGELYIGKVLSLRGGYNYQRRQEMKIETKTSTVGFSWGIGIRVSKFQFSYARSAYHLVGSPNYITVTTNLSDFYTKKN
jgi:hypothetical protein